jgi:hypothetical protein
MLQYSILLRRFLESPLAEPPAEGFTLIRRTDAQGGQSEAVKLRAKKIGDRS